MQASESAQTNSQHRGTHVGHVLDGPTCFRYLVEATKQAHLRPGTVSLVSMWNFTNVLYYFLQQLHEEENPINAAMLVDEASDKRNEVDMKLTMKGEVVSFLMRTARTFGSRSVAVQDPNSVSYVLAMNFGTRRDFNTMWYRNPYDVAGRPSFRLPSTPMFLYYRPATRRWVIDDVISPSGAVYSSSEAPGLNGWWTTSPGWMDRPRIRVSKVGQGGTVLVSGCVDEGGSMSPLENGTYVRDKDLPTINGHAHYVKEGRPGENPLQSSRRHLFYAEQGRWLIAPTCTEEEGSYIQSAGPDVGGIWRAIGPDHREHIKFIFKTEDRVELEESDVLGPPAARNKGPDAAVPATRAFDEGASAGTGAAASASGPDPAMPHDDQAAAAYVPKGLLSWNEQNHEALLFNNETHSVFFLASSAKQMRQSMHPGLLEYLQANRIHVGENLYATSTSRHHDILVAITGVSRSRAEASALLGGSYSLTGDGLLKILAIFTRVRCGVPVVLLGEAGAGKTQSIRFLAAWLGAELYTLDVHGGTTEADILQVFERAFASLATHERVFVFLDELNTCEAMGLIEEAICQRSLNGIPLPDGIVTLGALNPYRERVATEADEEMARVGLASTDASGFRDPMAHLVYRVHPTPLTLQELIFDFGFLTGKQEATYIALMVDKAVEQGAASTDSMQGINEQTLTAFKDILGALQDFVRKWEGDPSSVSLRDVKRCLDLLVFFMSLVDRRRAQRASGSTLMTNDKKESSSDHSAVENNQSFARCASLALCFTYYFRLGSAVSRQSFFAEVRVNISRRSGAFRLVEKPGALENLLEATKQQFCQRFLVEEGIALNRALSENLFVMVVCMLNKIPVFCVGPPGGSKTLSLQVALSNLAGRQSPKGFWRRFPGIALFPYQCSPLSSADAIQRQFDVSCRFQKHATDQIACLLLDEVGLAPPFALKVLHRILVNPPVAVVGLSNWTLDRAKMNRALLIARPEPTAADLRLTSARIFGDGGPGGSAVPRWLAGVTDAYHNLIQQERKDGREFYGMRDLFGLMKMLRKASERGPLTPRTLITAVCRNFGGRREKRDEIVTLFLDKYA